MAMTPTQIANQLVNEWRPGFGEAPNEDRVATRGFSDAAESGAQKIKNTLYLRKIGTPGAANVQTLTAGGAARLTNLTLWDDAGGVIAVAPTFYYVGQEWTYPALTRMANESNKLRAGYRRQFTKSLATKFDTVGAALATSIVANVVGGAIPLSLDILADAVQALAITGKDHWQPEQNNMTATIINTQIKNLLTTNQFVQADLRGETNGPLVKGWVWKALGVNIAESGNIYTAGGTAHNLITVPDGCVYGYNQEAMLLDPERDGLAIYELAIMEVGLKIYFDEYCCDMKTAA